MKDTHDYSLDWSNDFWPQWCLWHSDHLSDQTFELVKCFTFRDKLWSLDSKRQSDRSSTSEIVSPIYSGCNTCHMQLCATTFSYCCTGRVPLLLITAQTRNSSFSANLIRSIKVETWSENVLRTENRSHVKYCTSE